MLLIIGIGAAIFVGLFLVAYGLVYQYETRQHEKWLEEQWRAYRAARGYKV